MTTEQLTEYVQDDPVRPHLSAQFRTDNESGRVTYGLIDGEEVQAIVCTQTGYGVPKQERDLHNQGTGDKVVSPYTIWSYTRGRGTDLINMLLSLDLEGRLVTLSPKTEMARRFHIKNGAFLLQENEDTINYEYPKKTIPQSN